MRKGFDGLAVMVQQVLEQSPHSRALFAFRGKRGDLVKLLWYDDQGLCFFGKRMDRGRFIWLSTKTGPVAMTPAQLRCCWKALTGALRCAVLPRLWRGEVKFLRHFF